MHPLSRRQIWRMTIKKKIKQHHEVLRTQFTCIEPEEKELCEINDKVVENYHSFDNLSKYHENNSKYNSESPNGVDHIFEEKKKPRSKLSFCNFVSVILVPTSKEYRENNLFESLWWSEDEFLEIQKNIIFELRLLKLNTLKEYIQYISLVK